MKKIDDGIRMMGDNTAPLQGGDVFIKTVTTEQELLEVFKLRYAVYCLEKGYENPDNFPSGLEIDEYDPYSVHMIAYSDQIPVGTARLILPNRSGLPIERFCGVDVRTACSTMNVAEISRLAVSAGAAKRYGIDRSKVTLGLIRQIYLVSSQLKVMYCFAAMRKALERLFRTCGINFIRAGDPVEYHGIRVPYFTHVEDFTKNIFRKRHDLHEIMFPSEHNTYPAYAFENSHAVQTVE